MEPNSGCGTGGMRAAAVTDLPAVAPGDRVTVTYDCGARLTSTVARKALMAVTGLILVAFLLMHMFGNTKLLIPEIGAQEFDEYSHYLRRFLYPVLPPMFFLWLFRIALLLSAAVHIIAAVQRTKGQPRLGPIQPWLYRMQQKAEDSVKRGDVVEATRRLENLATRLLAVGREDLAQMAMVEARRVSKTSALSEEGRKALKFGTRMLLALPQPGEDR